MLSNSLLLLLLHLLIQNKNLKKLISFIVLLVCQSLLAQDPYSINYSINEGFPTSTVYSANHDERGYLWFSTDVGIVKYDSHKFELFNTDNGLSDNEVFQMKTDFKGRTWLLTLTGKLSFIYKDKIYNESNSSLIKKASGTSITVDFYQDETNTIYIVYRNGEIAIIKPNNEVIKKNNKVLSLTGFWKNKDSTYIINNGVSNLITKKRVKPFSKSSFYRIHHSKFGNYLSDTNILYKIHNDNTYEKVVEIPLKIEILNSYIEKENKMWICARNGLYLIIDNKLKQTFFTDYAITSITKDFEGGYWVSTLSNGVIYIPSFNFYTDKLTQDKSTKVSCISINDKNEIWVGGYNNDYYVKKKNENFEKRELFSSNRKDKINNIRFKDNVTYVIGKIGIKKIDSNGSETILGFSANDMYIDNDQTFVGYTYTYTAPTSKIDFIKATGQKPKLFIDKRTSVFSEGENNCVWVGTNNGLYQVDKNNSLYYWGNKNSNLQSPIEDIFYDKETNTVFVATASKGILTIRKNKINRYSNAEGLNSNTCNSIKKISSTNYLIGTNNGLNLLTFRNNKCYVKNLNAILSLKNSRINDIDYLDNKVYLATLNGLLHFSLDNLSSKKTKPKCHILKLLSNNKLVINNFSLPYNQKDISIEFNGISFLNQGNLTYFFKLNNKNEDWTKSNESKINYKSLPAGKYTFYVYCQDGFNEKSEIKSISFEILPPFWQKLWFLILAIVFGVFLIYLFIKFRLNKQKRKFEEEKQKIQIERDKAQLEKQMVELEQKALRLQMNPHFIFNALNTIKGYYSEGDALNASSYISKFSKLLRMLLENTEQTIPLKKEIEMLDIYIKLTKIRYKDKFEYELIVDENLNISETLIPTLLLQPMVENAIIHGLAPKEEKGRLKVQFVKKADFLECIVEDNGIGRVASKMAQKNKEYQSKAIEITNERLELFNNNLGKSTIEIFDLQVNSIPSGTKVVITIPLISIW